MECRVLLERLVVARPHPWGLFITFFELIKNPQYNFWSNSFTRYCKTLDHIVVIGGQENN